MAGLESVVAILVSDFVSPIVLYDCLIEYFRVHLTTDFHLFDRPFEGGEQMWKMSEVSKLMFITIVTCVESLGFYEINCCHIVCHLAHWRGVLLGLY